MEKIVLPLNVLNEALKCLSQFPYHQVAPIIQEIHKSAEKFPVHELSEKESNDVLVRLAEKTAEAKS